MIALGAGALALAAASVLALRRAARSHEPITSAAIDLEPAPASSTSTSVDRWVLGGTGYTKVTDQDATRTPPRVRGLRRADGPGASDFGSLGQGVSAARFAGKRVRFSADLKTTGVDQRAGLWMRVDAGERHPVLDNMANRPVRGTTPFTRFAVVVDVPASATALVVGLLLVGSGTAVFTDARLEIVGPDVAVTTLPVPVASELPPDFTA